MEDQTTAGPGGTQCVDLAVEGIASRATVGEDDARSCSRRGRRRERRPAVARDVGARVATRDAEAAAAVRDAGIQFFWVATRD
jgi:hypothetical protein